MPFSARSFSKAARATNEQRRQFPANSVTVSETNYFRSKAYTDTRHFNAQKPGG
jgi:hypothetical protein